MRNHCNLLQTIKSRWCGVVFDEPLPEAHAAGAVISRDCEGLAERAERGCQMAQLGKNVAVSADIAAQGCDLPLGEVARDHLCDMLPHRLVDRLLWKLEHDDARRFRPLPVVQVPYGDFFEMKSRCCGQT